MTTPTPRQSTAAARLPADLRSTGHAVTCDYLVGRRFRTCTCRPRAAR